jgi:hypothetical protein
VLADNYGRKFGGKYGTAMTQIDRWAWDLYPQVDKTEMVLVLAKTLKRSTSVV